jgi:hypothetical protein
MQMGDPYYTVSVQAFVARASQFYCTTTPCRKPTPRHEPFLCGVYLFCWAFEWH